MQSSSPAQMKALAATEKDRSRASLPEAGLPEELAFKSPLAGSYQQISCLDSVVRCSPLASLPTQLLTLWGSLLHEALYHPPTGTWRAAARPPP